MSVDNVTDELGGYVQLRYSDYAVRSNKFCQNNTAEGLTG